MSINVENNVIQLVISFKAFTKTKPPACSELFLIIMKQNTIVCKFTNCYDTITCIPMPCLYLCLGLA